MTSKAQTTIPQAVRTALGLTPGDDIAYVIENDRVVITRYVTGSPTEDPFPTFSEWQSPADTAAFRNL